MYVLKFVYTPSHATYQYYFKELPPRELLKDWLIEKIEWIKIDDPTDVTWAKTIHVLMLRKIDRLPIPGHLVIDKNYTISLTPIQFEDL